MRVGLRIAGVAARRTTKFIIFFGSVEELCEHQDDIIHYPYCEDMEDVARYLIEETGSLGKVPINLQNYID